MPQKMVTLSLLSLSVSKGLKTKKFEDVKGSFTSCCFMHMEYFVRKTLFVFFYIIYFELNMKQTMNLCIFKCL